jgi:acetyl esterase/lipase
MTMLITRRELGMGATALMAASAFGKMAIAAERNAAPAAIDPANLLNPEIREQVLEMTARMPQTQFTAGTLAKIRAGAGTFQMKPLTSPAIRETMIPGPAGAPQVKVLVIGATVDSKNRPAVLYIHGGGFILGSAMGEVVSAQNLATALDCVVVSVDYRLAPETRFPGAREDNYAALRWVYDNAAALGVDRKRIAIFGGSAGGGHAAALAIAARNRGEVPICYQVLIYPMLDDRTGSTRMPPPFIGAYGWTADSNKFGWTSLLGVPPGGASVPEGAVPARVADLSGLPPAFVGVGSLDLFAEEDIEYAKRLLLAGVPTKLMVVPGAIHGFDSMAATRIAKEFTSSWRAELAARFAQLAG